MEKSLFEIFGQLEKEDLGVALVDAVKAHRMDEIRYLLTSPELKEHADINIYAGAPLRNATRYDFFDIVKYLLTSPELTQHANIDAETGYPFKTACRHGYLDILKFFLESPKLKNRIDIHHDDDIGFRVAFTHKQLEVMQYLIFDRNMEENQTIKEYTSGYLNSTDPSFKSDKEFAIKVNNMFRLRDLNKQLHDELPVAKQNNKKVKI
jgi:hypothetical protein